MNDSDVIENALKEIFLELQDNCRSQHNLKHYPMNQNKLTEAMAYLEHGEYGLSFEYLMSEMRSLESCISARSAYRLVRVGIMLRACFARDPWRNLDKEFGNNLGDS